MLHTDERVLVVDRSAHFGGDWPQGFVPLNPLAALELVRAFEASARFEPRARAESQPAWKQCIPYCVLGRGAEVFCVERHPTQGEGRLHGKLSIGIGGHVGPEDSPTDGALHRALARELAEELVIPSDWVTGARLVGLLNDDEDAVGSVHTGLVFVLACPPAAPAPGIREISKMAGSFRPLAASAEAWQDAARLESWSAALLPLLPSMLSAGKHCSPDGWITGS